MPPYNCVYALSEGTALWAQPAEQVGSSEADTVHLIDLPGYQRQQDWKVQKALSHGVRN